jgi:hypothetical protein
MAGATGCGALSCRLVNNHARILGVTAKNAGPMCVAALARAPITITGGAAASA